MIELIKESNGMLEIETRLSTVFHLQKNRQIEQIRTEVGAVSPDVH